MRHVFIIGSRGLPAKYGGFETFVEELVKHKQSQQLTYHVACLSETDQHKHFTYLGVDCFTIKAPKLGPARVIAYDMMAIRYALKLIKDQKIKHPIFYILGNTIGAFMGPFARKIKRIGGRFYINPDGLEWRRSKWSRPVQAYLKYAEKCMTKKADLVISDNTGIEGYIKQMYPWAKTAFIAYGTDLSSSGLSKNDSKVKDFYKKWAIKDKGYYLIVGRFVPENNYETAIREFMTSSSERDLVIICNYEGNAYFEDLRQKTEFDKDKRIKFVGTVYDRPLLTYIREQAFAYIHGHEVGGTNPGLLEALAHTDLNLVLITEFNYTVALDAARYWTQDSGSLAQLINQFDKQENFAEYGQRAKEIIVNYYTWEKIVEEYEDLFLHES
ncbi:beta 1-4 rhamnosyltransferase Cps2T [Streptococcus mutans]|uniref:beta 1-4 rhamnosyltransferase Cps2T n=1 Tax=Streptococcus mutans TaxID=1309 RepID=UPI001CFE0CAC|nr:glycosyltransferase family 1 protein [Streptococcus mutans]